MYIHIDDTPELAEKVKEVKFNGEKFEGVVRWLDTNTGKLGIMRKKTDGKRGYDYPVLEGKVEIVFQ